MVKYINNETGASGRNQKDVLGNKVSSTRGSSWFGPSSSSRVARHGKGPTEEQIAKMTPRQAKAAGISTSTYRNAKNATRAANAKAAKAARIARQGGAAAGLGRDP